MEDRPSPWRPLEGSGHAVALEVLLHGPLSRSELARRMHLSHASLSRLTKPLVTSGLLVEGDATVASGMGRPQQPLDVVEDSHHFVGVKITGERVHAVVTTMRARTVADSSLPLPDHEVATVVGVVARLVAEARDQVDDIAGIGVSVGGLVADGTRVEHAAFLGWDSVPLGDLVSEATGLPVVLENDLIALTEAENWFGAGRHAETFSLLTIGAGIGYGLVVHGRLVTSDEARLGPMGHTLVAPDGPRCPAGHRGCAAGVLTTQAIRGAYAVAAGTWPPIEEIFALARDGDDAARRVVDDAGRALGRLIGTATAFSLSPSVVLSGEAVGLAEVAREAVDAGTWDVRHPLAGPVELEVRGAGFDEWARAAAVVAVQAFVTGG